jgi:CRISPR-associated endonuclease Cas1
VNAMLSFGYTMLLKEVLPLIESTGLDPYLGFLHAPEYGRPSLALDIMEEFRSVIVDQLVLKLINKRILTADDFVGLDSGGMDGVFLKKVQINVFLRTHKHRANPFSFAKDDLNLSNERGFHMGKG